MDGDKKEGSIKSSRRVPGEGRREEIPHLDLVWQIRGLRLI